MRWVARVRRKHRDEQIRGSRYESTPKEISVASLKRKGNILMSKPIPLLDQSFFKTLVIQVLEVAVEDNLMEGLKTYSAEEEVECDVILKHCIETPTI
ncbi:hypothetical protein HAX54_007326 [Datura stramonium]|uniref:Uncharacterized protein n=1 Tax=Datura stramonium TaxID=4076 RepID=A0ABS8TD42_DATST|nr:hypothetical protein [Datura stramonium]